LNIKQYIPIVIKALETASEKIMEIYLKDFSVKLKTDNSPVTEADITSSYILNSYLEQLNIPIISEEEIKPQYEVRKNESLIWLVDPLDGTKEFINKNNQFCICISLIHNGTPILGFIANPTTKEILFGGTSIGVYKIPFGTKNQIDSCFKVNPPKLNKSVVIAHSNAPYSEQSKHFVKSVEYKYGEVAFINKGSALKFFDLATGKADFYIRLAPTMEWDIAAGQAIYEALGGEVLNYYTQQPLTYNKENLLNPHFIAKLKTTKLDYNES